jgi:hypothetical protein
VVKLKKFVIALAALVSVGVLSGCASGPENIQPPVSGRAASYEILTDWSKVPGNSDDTYSDLWVRTIKVEGNCFVHSFGYKSSALTEMPCPAA